MPPDTPTGKPGHEDAQFIGPVDLTPPGTPSPPGKPGRRVLLGAAAVLLLAAVLAGGVLLVRHFTGRPPPPAPAPAPATPPEAAPPAAAPSPGPPPAPAAPPEPGRPSRTAAPPAAAAPENPPAAAAPAPAVDPQRRRRLKTAAEEQLARYLKSKQRLDRLGAALWGAQDYREILRLADDGDARYRAEDYPAAAEMYRRAAEKSARLADRAPAALEALLARALSDIEAGDGPAARRRLEAAQKIDPADKRIAKLLRRAATAEEVHRLTQEGGALAEKGAIEKALAAYRRALKLDPAAPVAREAADRLQRRVALQRYRHFMSLGLAAMERGQYGQAVDLLRKARAAAPGRPEARDALSQAEDGLRRQRIEALRREALAAESAEDWPRALQAYQAILKIDDRVGFAVDGRKRAAAQIKRLQRVDFFTKNPQALQNDRRLEEARRLVAELENTAPRGPRAAARTAQLKALVEAWQTPVAVTIHSDGATRVAVYRVGRLGRFTQRRIELRPGTYTVVGSRDGYQDVRQTVTVKPGQQSLEITVICKNKV